MLSIFPTYTSIDELMKISPPLVLHPTFDWFLLLIQNNRTLTSPSLRVFGDVKSTENGLTFDGETGWVETDLLEGLFLNKFSSLFSLFFHPKFNLIFDNS